MLRVSSHRSSLAVSAAALLGVSLAPSSDSFPFVAPSMTRTTIRHTTLALSMARNDGGSRNQTDDGTAMRMTSNRNAYYYEDDVTIDDEEVVESEAETSSPFTLGDASEQALFPLTDVESMRRLGELESLVRQTLEEERCDEDQVPPTASCDDVVNYGNAAVARNDTPSFPFTDSESLAGLADLEALIARSLEEEQRARLEELVEAECYDVTMPFPSKEEDVTQQASAVEERELPPLQLASSVVDVDSGRVITMVAQPKGLGDVVTARLLLVGAAALYGTNFALVKILDDTVPVGASTSLRFTLAAVAALPWLLPVQDSDTDTDQDFWGPTLAGMEVGMWNSVGYIAQAVGLETVCASKSAFICSLAVVFVPILDALTGKVMSLQKMFGILMAVSGVAILELGDTFFHTPAAGDAVKAVGAGDFISLLQPLAFGIGFWRMEHATMRYPDEAPRLTSSQLLSVALVSVAYCAVGVGGVAPPSLPEVMGWIQDYHILGALLWTGIVTTALTIFMETTALRSISAAEATLIFSTEPIWGSAFAALVVGERLGIEAGLGAAMILGGCLVSGLNLKGNDDDNTNDDNDVSELRIMEPHTTKLPAATFDSTSEPQQIRNKYLSNNKGIVAP